MNRNNDSKSIKEIADILGCSVQAIYNRLEKDFKPYLKIENGKKRLDIGILEYINKDDNSSEFKIFFKANLNLLEKQNEQLSKELDIKNEQIKELNARLKESNDNIKILQKTLDQQQQLNLIEKKEKQQILEIEDGSKKKKSFLWW